MKIKKINLLIVISLSLFQGCSSGTRKNDDEIKCKSLTNQSSELIQNDEVTKAAAILEEAVSACEKPTVGTIDPLIELSQNYFNIKNFSKSIAASEKALQKLPGLQIAYMNICAAETMMENYEAAVQACKSGLESKLQISSDAKKDWLPKLNFNMGLALFKSAVSRDEYTDISSEPYFREAIKLDPQIAQAYFYLGIITEIVKNNPIEAKTLFAIGCRLNDSESCNQLQGIDARINKKLENAENITSSIFQTQPQGEALSSEEESLLQQLEGAYMKKGVPEAEATEIVSQIRKTLLNIPMAQRKSSIQSMLNAMD